MADRLGEGGVRRAQLADDAFVDGLSAAFLVGALLAAGAAALVVVGGWSRQQAPGGPHPDEHLDGHTGAAATPRVTGSC